MKPLTTSLAIFFFITLFFVSGCKKITEVAPHTDIHYSTLQKYLEREWHFDNTLIDGLDSTSVFKNLKIILTFEKFQTEDISYSGLKIVDRSIIFRYSLVEKSSLFPENNGQIKLYLVDDYIAVPYGIRSNDNMIFEFVDFEKNVNELNSNDTLTLHLIFPANIEPEYLNIVPGTSDHEHDILLKD